MNYEGFLKTSLVNGHGIRCVLFATGCIHRCKNCQNPWSWNPENGNLFNEKTMNSIMKTLQRPWVDGITFSGGDPLYPYNRKEITDISRKIKENFSNKTIWVYTGYKWEDIKDLEVMKYIDVVVDGKFIEKLAEKSYRYAGSINQRVIDVQKSLTSKEVVLWT